MWILLVIKWRMKNASNCNITATGTHELRGRHKEDILLRCLHGSFLFQMILLAECTEDQLVSIATFFSWIWNQTGVREEPQTLLAVIPNHLLDMRLWLGECLYGINTNMCRLFPKSPLPVQLKISTVVYFPSMTEPCPLHYNLTGYTCYNQYTPNLSTSENFDF